MSIQTITVAQARSDMLARADASAALERDQQVDALQQAGLLRSVSVDLVSRLLANRYPPLLSITIAVGIGAVLLLAVSAITTGITVSYPWPVWALFLYLGLVPTALGYALLYIGVQHTTASEASVASLVEPLTATGLALIIFGEHLSALGLLGATLLIGAIVFLYRNGPSRAG